MRLLNYNKVSWRIRKVTTQPQFSAEKFLVAASSALRKHWSTEEALPFLNQGSLPYEVEAERQQLITSVPQSWTDILLREVWKQDVVERLTVLPACRSALASYSS